MNIGEILAAKCANVGAIVSLLFDGMKTADVQFQRTARLKVGLFAHGTFEGDDRWFAIFQWGFAMAGLLMVFELTIAGECLQTYGALVGPKMVLDVFVSVITGSQLIAAYFTGEFKGRYFGFVAFDLFCNGRCIWISVYCKEVRRRYRWSVEVNE